MKKILILMTVLMTLQSNAQTYVSTSLSYYNGGGPFKQQAEPVLEVGRYLADDFSIGLAVGRTSFGKGDSLNFAEIRPTFYYTSGKFSQGFTTGLGCIFTAEAKFMVEWATNTCYQFHKNWGGSIFMGGYNFNGKFLAMQSKFVGVGLTYTFKK